MAGLEGVKFNYANHPKPKRKDNEVTGFVLVGVCTVLFYMVACAHFDNRFNRFNRDWYFMDYLGNGDKPVELHYPIGLMKYDLIHRREHLVYARKRNHPADFILQAEKQIKQLEKAIDILENYKEPETE